MYVECIECRGAKRAWTESPPLTSEQLEKDGNLKLSLRRDRDTSPEKTLSDNKD